MHYIPSEVGDYLPDLIAACGGVSERGKLVCVTIKIDITFYMFRIECITLNRTLIPVPFGCQVVNSSYYILITINSNRAVFFGIIETVVL